MDIKSLTKPVFSLKWWSSWFFIFLGCTLLAAGYVFFISPYNIVPGGVYGASIVLHNIFPGIQVGTFGYMTFYCYICLENDVGQTCELLWNTLVGQCPPLRF